MIRCTGCNVEKKESEFHKRTWTLKDGTKKVGYDLSRCKTCQSARWKKYKEGVDPDVQWRNHIKRTYGITEEDYCNMWNDQEGLCAICGSDHNKGRRFAIDHCHDTGKVRGLLCDSCNWMLGNAKDNIKTLAKGIEYLTIAESADAVGKERRDE